MSRGGGRRGGPAVRLVAGAAAALVCLVAWALASAPGSSPDDNFHLPSIWCAHGEQSFRCAAVPGDDDARAVPAGAAGLYGCFVGDATASARCADDPARSRALLPTVTGNWEGGYPPVYYWVLGWLIGGDVALSVLLMRILAAGVVVGLVAALTALLPDRLRALATVPLVVTSVPIGLSLVASTNPSGWAFASAATAWVALHGAFETAGRRAAGLCAVAIAAVVVGAGARADAGLFVVMAVGLVAIVDLPRLRRRRGVTLVMALAAAVAVALFLGAGQSSALTGGLSSEQVTASGTAASWWRLALENTGRLPILWLGSLGSGPMGATGWLDTSFPPLVPFLTVAVLAVLVAASLRRRFDRLQWTAVGLCAAALFVYPLYVLGRTGLAVGAGMQPRYLVPVVVILVGLLVMVGRPTLRRGQVVALSLALAVAQAVALHVQVRRYVTGLDESGLGLDAGREWWWGGPVGPTTVWILGAVAFAVLAHLVLDQLRPEVDPDSAVTSMSASSSDAHRSDLRTSGRRRTR